MCCWPSEFTVRLPQGQAPLRRERKEEGATSSVMSLGDPWFPGMETSVSCESGRRSEGPTPSPRHRETIRRACGFGSRSSFSSPRRAGFGAWTPGPVSMCVTRIRWFYNQTNLCSVRRGGDSRLFRQLGPPSSAVPPPLQCPGDITGFPFQSHPFAKQSHP